ncbi:hypothetical protein GJ699_06075 [Duganella sp. FT80W]|uniref:Uncharacterized protein n=1 Tax=Duganella guangzhouensis TaxID=2666084 RepID=A0A6I2KX20_9BURK|nr:hypothetical protein [Duganella guangzhouensis]MRW89547.1 hypothetical protein [Duganella guangzhouensis]
MRAFLRAVRDATGQLYRPAIYQRLLAAVAPERRPSTATLAAEKQALAGEAKQSATRAEDCEIVDVLALQTIDVEQLRLAVTDAIDAGMVRFARSAGGNGGQLAFYAARLSETEQQLLAVREQAARLATDLALARQLADHHERDAQRTGTALALEADAVAKLAAEVTEMRLFALRSIDEARGEARVWKERSVVLEAQRQLDARLLETFRQKAYRAGAEIPDLLRQDKRR